MTATRRRYQARDKAKALGIAAVEGVSEAERQTGIPKTTIQYWTERPEFVQLRTRAKEEVASEMWVGIQIGLKHLVIGLEDPDVPLRDKATAWDSISEKYALLTGGATSRSETKALTDAFPDEDRAKLRVLLDDAAEEIG